MLRSISFAVLALALGGCFAVARDPSAHLGDQAGRAEKLQRLQRGGDAREIRKLRKYLEEEASFDAPLSHYAQVRDAELSQLGDSKRAKFSFDAASGVPAVYRLRLETALRAQLRLATLLLEQGQPEPALAQVHAALARTQRQSVTRIERARWSRECFTLAEQIHERRGDLGAARAAKLQSDLVSDYLRSPAAAADYLDEGSVYDDIGRKQLAQSDQVVIGTNSARLRAQLERNRRIEAAVAGASAAAVRSAASAQLDDNGGVVTPEIERAQVYAEMLDTQAAAIGAVGTSALPRALALAPTVSDVILTQFAEPSLRVDALSLVREFAKEIPGLVGRPDLAEVAERTLQLADEVEKVAKGDTAERIEAARALASEMSSLIERL